MYVYFVWLAFYQLNTFISSTIGDPDTQLDEPRPHSSHLAGEPGEPTGLALLNSLELNTITGSTRSVPSLSLVGDVQLQGTLNPQHNHRTRLIYSMTIHPGAPRLSPGRTSPLLHLIIPGSGSYTQQRTSHAIACVQAFTRRSSNSLQALLTGTLQQQHLALSEYVLRACHKTMQCMHNTSRASQSSARIQPNPCTHRPTFNFSINSFSNINHILELQSTAINQLSAPQPLTHTMNNHTELRKLPTATSIDDLTSIVVTGGGVM